jgi:ligand-binding sensor protein
MKPCQSYINQITQKRRNITNKMEGLKSKKTKEPCKKVNQKGNIQFSNPLLVARGNIKLGKGRTS